MLESIIREIQATEEMLEDNEEQYKNGNMNYLGYEYFKNKIITDTYELIKQILKIEKVKK